VAGKFLYPTSGGSTVSLSKQGSNGGKAYPLRKNGDLNACVIYEYYYICNSRWEHQPKRSPISVFNNKSFKARQCIGSTCSLSGSRVYEAFQIYNRVKSRVM